MKTLALITNIPTPYRIPFFNVLRESLEKNGFHLFVIFGAKGYNRRQWEIDEAEFKFDYLILDSTELAIAGGESASFNYKNLTHTLKKIKPSIVVTAGYGICTLKAIIHCFLNRSKLVLWSGDILNVNRNVGFTRRIYRKLIVKMCDGGIAYGNMAKKYLQNLGMEENKISIAINSVDTSYFDVIKDKVSSRSKKLLYVGNLTKFKRVDLLLDIVLELKNLKLDFVLDIVGTGHEEKKLKKLATDMSILKHVNFLGFKQKQDLKEIYGKADLFLFPSEYDIWGLVMVESMASGVPVITSVMPGAVDSLIVDRKTGIIVDFQKPAEVSYLLLGLLKNTTELDKMSINAKQHIKDNVNLHVMSLGFMEQVKKLS